jgi:hypothetical protein
LAVRIPSYAGPEVLSLCLLVPFGAANQLCTLKYMKEVSAPYPEPR